VRFLPTFADFLDTHGLPDAPDLDEDTQVTIAWLHYDQAVYDRIEEIKADPKRPGSYSLLLAVLAEEIITSHLGADWFAAHIDGRATSDQARDYLPEVGPAERRLLSTHRIHELARRLYQLQSFEWFEHVLRSLRTRDLSGAGFELDVLWVLHVLPSSVAPRAEIGRKGEDYDAVVRFGGLTIPIEVKAKADDTELSQRTVVRTVRGAARQLPKGQKGIVLLRIPNAWVGRQLEEQYNDWLREATRQTSRVGAVVTAIDKPHLNEAGTQGHVDRHYDFFCHPDCPDELWKYCLWLKVSLDLDRTHLAPMPPF
jgi:hypothetical protein